MKTSGATPPSPAERAADRSESLFARFLFGIGGFSAGSILGIVASFLVLDLLSRGNSLLIGFGMALALPLSLLVVGIPGLLQGLRLLRYLTKPAPGSQSRKVRSYVIASLLIGYPSVIAALIVGIHYRDAPPSDRALIAGFSRHRQDLDQIVTMLHRNRGLTRVADSWTEPTDSASLGISADRIADYRRLLRAIGSEDGLLVRDSPSQIEFMCWGRGSAVSSDDFKGYAYLPTPPKADALVDDLDAGETGRFCRYRHLVGNWYLYRMHIPG